MEIAAMTIVTWLAGSYSDGQKAARLAIDKRNRLLFQAERLKTLRVMSVAIIHEISQPLSTLAIEAKHLKDVTKGLGEDIALSADMIDRKAQVIADMVRHLRRFGGRDSDKAVDVSIQNVLRSARQIMMPSAGEKAVSVQIEAPERDLYVHAQEVELTQAVVNLVRNAMTATSDQSVWLSAAQVGDQVQIHVRNTFAAKPASSSGMGIGLIIARTIVEAHGGVLSHVIASQEVTFTISLPLSGNH